MNTSDKQRIDFLQKNPCQTVFTNSDFRRGKFAIERDRPNKKAKDFKTLRQAIDAAIVKQRKLDL